MNSSNPKNVSARVDLLRFIYLLDYIYLKEDIDKALRRILKERSDA